MFLTAFRLENSFHILYECEYCPYELKTGAHLERFLFLFSPLKNHLHINLWIGMGFQREREQNQPKNNTFFFSSSHWIAFNIHHSIYPISSAYSPKLQPPIISIQWIFGFLFHFSLAKKTEKPNDSSTN